MSINFPSWIFFTSLDGTGESPAPNVKALAASLLPADCCVAVEVVDTSEVTGIWEIAAGGGIREIAAVS